MTLALATRGYLRRVVGDIEFFVGSGPEVTKSTELKPEIETASDGSTSTPVFKPVIVKAEDV